MISSCTRCGEVFDHTPAYKKNRGSICPSCQQAYDRERRARRKTEGRPVVTGNMSHEWHVAYNAQYLERPGIRERLAARSREAQRNPESRWKVEARYKAQRAVRAGRLVRQPCEVCGSPVTDAHHDDYTKPVEVRWLCRKHHAEHHHKAKARGEAER